MIKIEDINSVSDIESLNSKEIEAIVLSVGDNLFELSQDGNYSAVALHP